MTGGKLIDFTRWGRDHVLPSGGYTAFLVDIWAGDESETECLFEREGRGLMACNNLHLVKGREKTGKSAFGVLLITAALSGAFLDVQARKEEMRVLWIDTEQDVGTLKQKARKAVEMAQDKEKGARARVYSLKSLNPTERLKTALDVINGERPDFVFLDGLADLCVDFNDQKESKQIVDALANVAENTGCALLAVIHTNKTDKSEARGHVGAIAQQKAGEVYEVKREMGGNVADVKQMLSRFGSVPDISFEFGEGFALLPAYGGLTKQEDARRKQQEELRGLFGKALAGGIKLCATDLKRKLMELEGKSERWASEKIQDALGMDIIDKAKEGKNTVYSFLLTPGHADANCCKDEAEK